MSKSKISYSKAKKMIWEASMYQNADKVRMKEIINDMFDKGYLKTDVKDKMLEYVEITNFNERII